MNDTALAQQAVTSLTDSSSSALYRELPFNIEAEQHLLGALIVNNELLNRVGDIITAESYFEPIHQDIFAAITHAVDHGIHATPITLKHQFDKDERLSTVGGAQYLTTLASLAYTIINVETYAHTIQDLFVRRRLIGLGEDIVNDAYAPSMKDTAIIQIERAEQNLFNLASEGNSERSFFSLRDSIIDATKRIELAYKRRSSISGITTGFMDLDSLLGGFQDSDLLILAGRPSMGKTALAVNLAINSCKAMFEEGKEDPTKKKSIGFFSLEMSAEQLATRLIAMASGINSSKLRTGNLTDEEFSRLVKGNMQLTDLPFYIDDTPALSISALRTRARRMKRKYNLGILVVDYLQLLRSHSRAAENSRVQEISEITQGLKAIAKELNIPVIALSQLSRAVEQREDKRPQLSDLRESGSIEQDADIVMFIYRDEYYLARKEPQMDTPKHAEWQDQMDKAMNITEVIIAKQRNGPIGTVQLYFDSNTTSFRDLADSSRHY